MDDISFRKLLLNYF